MFEPHLQPPAAFDTLTDWTQHEDPGIKFYSGAATYSGSFTFNPEESRRYWLQLNAVKDVGIATATLNGTELGATWTPPFRVESTEALKRGENRLEITVVNSWQNRLIGDRGKEQKDRFTRTNITIRDDWELRPSGLMGPMQLRIEP